MQTAPTSRVGTVRIQTTVRLRAYRQDLRGYAVSGGAVPSGSAHGGDSEGGLQDVLRRRKLQGWQVRVRRP
jgi:hypothetical protein